jgi:hypothetical protein
MRRLLFYPFDPLILPSRSWRPGMPALPRSALGPIAAATAVAMPQTVDAVEALINGQTSADMDAIRTAGTILWPAAATAIAVHAEPAAWRDTGMAVAHYRTLAPILAALLRQAPAIEALCQTSLPVLLPPPRQMVQALIRAVAAEHAPALPYLFGILMMRLPEPPVLFGFGRRDGMDAEVIAAREHAAELLLMRLDTDGPGAWIAGGDLTEAASMVRRLLSLLTCLEQFGSAARRMMCKSLRQRLDLAAQDRFEADLHAGFLAALRDTTQEPPALLEDSAWGLRIFQAEAREVGGRLRYDASLSNAAARLKTSQLAAGMQTRLTEILLGTEATLAQSPF